MEILNRHKLTDPAFIVPLGIFIVSLAALSVAYFSQYILKTVKRQWKQSFVGGSRNYIKFGEDQPIG